MRAPPKTTMSSPALALERRDLLLERRARLSRALFQVTSQALGEDDLGRPFISRAIGLSEPDQPGTNSS